MLAFRFQHPRHEGEDTDVAFVTDEYALFEIVHGSITICLVLFGPVQVVNVSHDGGSR